MSLKCSNSFVLHDNIDHCCTLIIGSVLFNHSWRMVMADSYQTQKPG